MILILPSQSTAEAKAELAAVREAGEHILASPVRTRAFLCKLGFRPLVKEDDGVVSKPTTAKKSKSR